MYQPIAAMREHAIDQLRKTVPVITHLFSTTPAADLTTYRDGGSGWTALEVLGHLLEFDRLFAERVRLMLETDSPALPFPDPDEQVRAAAYNAQAPADVLAGWLAARRALIAAFEAVDEAGWDRAGQHPTRGAYGVEDQLLLIPWHDANHLAQIAAILQAKQRPADLG
ncbi:MAG: DinB family protein [Anaerolineae bacterium]|nr:DinB family protein [Anaerolineae bacterium]